MNKIIYIIISINFILMLSCKNHRNLKDDLKRLNNSAIVIPQGMHVTYYGIDTIINDSKENTLKIIVYTDSTGCTSCGINKMYLWEPLLNHAKIYGDKLKYYFIFHPTNMNIVELRRAMTMSTLNHTMLIDENGDFEKLNPHLPKNKAMHTFLLDENNKVILVGNPLYNKGIEKLFYQKTQELLSK